MSGVEHRQLRDPQRLILTKQVVWNGFFELPQWWDRRRQWHPTPVLLPGKSHGWRSLEGCRPWDRWGSDTTEWLHFHFSLSCIGEGNGNPLQCSCLENLRDRGAWWVAIYGVAQSWTRLKWLSSSHYIWSEFLTDSIQFGHGYLSILTICLLINLCLGQEPPTYSPSMGQMQLTASFWCLINKAYLEHSQNTYLCFVYDCFCANDGQVEQLWHPGHKSENIYYLAFYRKSLPTSII